MPDLLMPQACNLTANKVQALNNLLARSVRKNCSGSLA